MRTKKTPKPRVPHFKPVRVVNPTTLWHTARIYPCQSMLLKLRNPCAFLTSTSAEAEFDVTLYSDFLIVEQVETDMQTGDKVYTINQKYDLSSWAEYGQVLLGEITIKVVNNEHPNKKEFQSNVCVIQNGDSRVLTAVNPIGHTCKIEPHQLLEIVCFDPDWNDEVTLGLSPSGIADQWDDAVTYSSKNGYGLAMRCVKYEVATQDSSNVPFAMRNRAKLAVNPYLSSMSKAIVKKVLEEKPMPVRQHHWWYAFTEQTLKKVLDLRNDVYEIGHIDLEGKCKSQLGEQLSSCWRSLDVKLAIHGKNKNKMHPFYLNPDSVEHKIEVIKRSEDRFKGILTNPLSTEQIDFHQGFDEITVEIVQPNALWSDLGEEDRWEIKVDDNQLTAKHVKITPMSQYFRWNKLFQRFKIRYDYKPRNDSETKFLGAVYITCKQKEGNHDGKKRISCWLTPTIKAEEVSTPTYSHSKKGSSSNSSSATVHKPMHSQWGQKKDRDYHGKPKLCTVQFEEVEFKTLEESTKTRKVSEIYVSNYTHTSYCDVSSYYHNGSMCGPELAKKKENSTWGFNSRMAQISRGETRRDFSDNETGKRGGDFACAKNGERRHPAIGSNVTSRTALIIYNPEHLYQIDNLEYGQPLIIRMSVPEKVLGYGTKVLPQEQWALEVTPNGEAMRVEYFRTIKVDDKVYQEARIVQDKVVPTAGIQTLGTVKFLSSNAVRAVFIMCKVSDPSDVNARSPITHDMKIAQPYKCFDGLNSGSKRLYISDWMHNDAFIVNPEEIFYVRNPGHASQWQGTCWQMDIEQFSLPDEVWRHEILKEVINDIDLDNPWFRTSHPLQLASTYVFRPLEIQQPHLKLILRAVANSTNLDVLPVARLIFRNSNHQDNKRVITPYGVIESRLKLERTLGICLSLATYRDKEIVLDNPANEEEVDLAGKHLLVVKLPSRKVELERGGVVKSPWYIGDHPPFLDLKGMHEEQDKNVFRFKVNQDFTERKTQKIRFISCDTEKIIMAKY